MSRALARDKTQYYNSDSKNTAFRTKNAAFKAKIKSLEIVRMRKDIDFLLGIGDGKPW